ncbi:MAG TPA: LysR family transcriptional regulator [Trinickia sp.]|jgi:DNA-binding transcriptional LysR family regulator|uniref:LysR family transcriptional regulator n=1 Tax=Trinickia sp. TaxID=2571163 RepID=UPI002C794D0A|nr:LysR family transcriptional regulator [Trinickia sp.]HVW50797.1 LysR family transcriptional regulator [Trinickia sp.]
MNSAQLPALVAFANVARHGSFTRAAAESGVSASALSQSIRALEAQLNVRLFNRTTRRVALTEAGAQFLERVQPALAMLAAACESLDEARGEATGTLRINLSRVASDLLVMPHLSEFTRRYPRVTVELALDEGLSDVVGEGFDAGIRLGERLARDMVAIPLSGPLRIVVAGSPAYFARFPKPATPDDLTQHDCLRYRFATSRGIYRWEFAQPAAPRRSFEVQTQGSFVTNDLRTMVQAAEQGVGLLHVIEDYVRPQLADGRLLRVLDDWALTFDGFSLYMPSRVQMPLKLRVFVDFLKEKHRPEAAGRARR